MLELVETLPETDDADDAAFSIEYLDWTLRERLNLPADQLRTVCQIWFNRGRRAEAEKLQKEMTAMGRHIEDLQHDCAAMMAEIPDDDGLTERERLTRAGYDGY